MIAVTGATGLLGRHILSRLLKSSEQIIALQRSENDPLLPDGVIKKTADILDPVSLSEAFKDVNTVIHVAAYVSFNPRRHEKILEVNVKGTQNVVNACLQVGVQNMIHISSVAALGRKTGEVLNEKSRWTGSGPSDYAESKYLAELEVFRGAEEGLTVSIINPSVILAASQSRSSSKLFDYSWRERKLYPKGTLNYVDARDVAEAVFKLYQNPHPGEKFILSAGNISFGEFFERTANLFNKRKPFIKVGSSLAYCAGWVGEIQGLLFNREPFVTRLSAKMAIQSLHYSHQKAEQVLGLQFRPLEETLKWCCEDYLRNVKPNK